MYIAKIYANDVFSNEDTLNTTLEGVVGQQIGQGGVVSLLFYTGKVRLMPIPVDGYIELEEITAEMLPDTSPEFQKWFAAKEAAAAKRAKEEAEFKAAEEAAKAKNAEAK